MNAPLTLTPEQVAPECDVNLYGDIAALFEALAKAQGEFLPIEKNKTGRVTPRDQSKQGYTFDYADMGEIRAKTTPALSKNGMGITSIPAMADAKRGGYTLRTILFHKSGARMESSLHIDPQADVKNFGGFVTYLRRYQVSAMLNIAADSDIDSGADDDDDGAPRVGPVASSAPSAHAQHPGLTKAQSVAELNKAWMAITPENRPKFQAQYDARMDELDPPPPKGKGAADGGGF